MRRCIQLASSGLGLVSPNPLVGCVIVNDDRIIGEGYHHKFGGPHAEVIAIDFVKDKKLLNTSTLYVNLEPCSHYGKTPPCADIIIARGIPRVVAGMQDPDPRVSGKGFLKLKQAGVNVSLMYENDCRYLNRRFITHNTKNRPYIILKWAQSMDGFIDKKRKPGEESRINWITADETRILVHRWRTEEDAIMCGTDTIILDNPQLTSRSWSGRNPLRVVIDRNGRLPANSSVLDGAVATLIFTKLENYPHIGPDIVRLSNSESILSQVLAGLHSRDILSVIVEGGRKLLQSFIDEGLWDEARIFTGPLNFNDGISSPNISGNTGETILLGEDILKIIYRKF